MRCSRHVPPCCFRGKPKAATAKFSGKMHSIGKRRISELIDTSQEESYSRSVAPTSFVNAQIVTTCLTRRSSAARHSPSPQARSYYALGRSAPFHYPDGHDPSVEDESRIAMSTPSIKHRRLVASI